MKNFNLIGRKSRFHVFQAASLLAAIAGTNTIDALAQALPTPKSYTCYRSEKGITIDGKLDERSWKKAAWTSSFVDIEGDKKPLPLQETRAKMLWDDEYLYIAAQIEEEHIWAYQDKKDQIVYLENDFEVFIDPDGDTENYYELEINAINNTFDLFLPKTYRKGGKAQLKWDIKGLKSAVSVYGTVNNAKDKDKRWVVEIAIPFSSLSTENVKPLIPADGSEWRINFSRVNWQHEVGEDGRYKRKRNAETGKIVPEYNWVWSPQGIINMHYPEYWGKLIFSGEKSGNAK
ncbi:Carbohydrate family 9 binding domain-like [Dyadobacter sp. SG02]|uniref:carbohydrate-binding family 9-like protein n=1 Tax=Dyadobacter sp. SG02 TaxID=1855291 RepID=UPI0008B0FD3F|nr:carbohydrate-binding family 9-like protein [Dyadobacter sp. SG02]SEI44541.1 Carbohydrate family 9 binding domain-like [Dyadobacter sp. SG02]